MQISQQLEDILQSFPFLLPEISLVGLFILVLVVDLIVGKLYTKWLMLIGLLGVVCITSLQSPIHYANQTLVNGMLNINPETHKFRYLLDFGALVSFLLYFFVNPNSKAKQTAEETNTIVGVPTNNPNPSNAIVGVLTHNSNQFRFSEEALLWLAVLIGAHFMLLANHWVALYLSVETTSIAAYALTVFRFKKESAEAAMKYLIFGAISSAISVYGISWVYGLTGELSFNISQTVVSPLLLQLGLLLAMSGVLFKIAAVPFHVWAPSVYQSAPLPVTAFFSIVPKIAGVMALFHIYQNLGWLFTATYAPLLIAALAILTMTFGNIAALQQKNFARLMAYSSISQAGFMLLAIANATQSLSVLLFYAKVYLLMNLVIFGVLTSFTHQGEPKMLNGLGKRMPYLGIVASIAIIALVGLPPTAGFTGKFLIFNNIWELYENTTSTLWLGVFVVGLLNTVLSLFYYIKIPYRMFFKRSNPNTPFIVSNHAMFLYLALLSFGLLALFIKPDLF